MKLVSEFLTLFVPIFLFGLQLSGVVTFMAGIAYLMGRELWPDATDALNALLSITSDAVIVFSVCFFMMVLIAGIARYLDPEVCG